MNERLARFRQLQAQYEGVGTKMTVERYLCESSKKDPYVWRQVVLVWFEDHPCMAEVERHCAKWYLVDGGQPA